MSQFKDLAEFMQLKPIELPIAGKFYQFPASVSAKTWVQLQAAMKGALVAGMQAIAKGEKPDLEAETLPEVDDDALMAEVMGDGLQAMIDDGVPGQYVQHVYITLLTYHIHGPKLALLRWQDTSEVGSPVSAAKAKGNGRGGALAPSR